MAWLVLAAILSIGALVYLPVTTFDFVDLDDPIMVTTNPHVNSGLNRESILWAFTLRERGSVRAAEGVANVWAPLSFLSHALDVEWWGLKPAGHHLTSVILHLFNTVLAFALFLRLSRNLSVAAFVAAVFCFHPMRVESVAWIAERKDVLSGFFAFSCLLLYHRWASARVLEGESARGFYWGSVAAFAAGCLSKPTVAVLPGLLVLIDIWPLKRAHPPGGWKSARRFIAVQVGEKWPFLVVAAAVAAIAIHLQYSGSHAGFMANHGFLRRMTELPALLSFYLERTLAPRNLFPDYPRYPHEFFLSSMLGLGMIAAISIGAWRFRSTCPALGFGWIWFLVSLAPVLGLFYVGTSFSSDRYSYLAHCGIAFLVAGGARFLAASSRPALRMLVGGLAIIVILAMGLLSHRQAGVWKDSGALFRHGVAVQPTSTSAWINLGAHLDRSGHPDEALRCFRSALEIRKDHDVYFNLGVLLGKTGGSLGEQVEAFRNALGVHPDYYPALRQLGLIMTDPGAGPFHNPAEGCRHLERACVLLHYRPAPETSALVKRLLNAHRERGDEEGYARVLHRAEAAGVLKTLPAP